MSLLAQLATALTFALAMGLTRSGPLDCVRFWGDGFWELLSFAMQMTLIMVSGYMVAVSRPVDRLLVATPGHFLEKEMSVLPLSKW
jgi:short-chain fatty acids transporter